MILGLVLAGVGVYFAVVSHLLGSLPFLMIGIATFVIGYALLPSPRD
jgi:hypothetical protein